ncbi:MAG TPA: sigma-70 family RNA polymerase sigma factor [Humisphaera sp.]|nr:sigma-70 family RNA polymerase sigma factor [Humisphaera sp.]
MFQQLADELERKRVGKPVLSKFGVIVEYITSVVQDPDVLDTWFSSALWPHSTLGWPEQTADLAKFYPTSVLLTGRDIITLWVARMVMMGMYNMGGRDGERERGREGETGVRRAGNASFSPSLRPSVPPSLHPSVSPSLPPSALEAKRLGLPFLDVAINPTILDGKGERMSKSKGNGVDPVDIVDSYGADALRFTLTKMATETQDARMPVKRDANGKNTSDKFDEGRNFCNKLWNACRFALSNLESVGSAPRTASPSSENAVRDADPTNLLPPSLGKSNDEDLMLRTQQGDKLAFSQLYERYSASVTSYLYQMLGNVEDNESMAQEVFLRAFRFAATYQHSHKFSTWLFTITRNLAIDRSRRRKESPIRNIAELNLEGIDMSGDPYQVAARATDDLEKQEEIARVLEALDGLPADQKEVIVLGVFQDLSPGELVQAVGSTSADAVSPPPRNASATAGPTYTLVDRWIIARFNRTLAACDEAIKSYRFDVYAKSCYDFFWGDFCDWYVEAIKPAMKDPARSGQTADVLAAVLDGALRLMHPMIPFITETVWWRLNDVRPHRGIPGRIECPPSKRLVLAKWPSATPIADSAEGDFPKLQAVISAIRTIRNDYQVNPKQAVEVFIKASDDSSSLIVANRELIEMLGACTLKDVRADLPAVENAVTAGAVGCDIFVTGLIDPNAEKARLLKESEAKKKFIETIESRMGNEAYIAKAPPKLVQQSRDQLATAREELQKIEESLRKLG